MWTLLAIGLAARPVAGTIVSDVVDHRQLIAFGLPDAFWLATYPFWYAALIGLGRRYLGGAHRSFWLDGLLIGLASASYVSALFLNDLTAGSGSDSLELLVTIAYPAADLALLGVLFGTVMMIGRPAPQGLAARRPAWSPRWPPTSCACRSWRAAPTRSPPRSPRCGASACCWSPPPRGPAPPPAACCPSAAGGS